MFENYKLKVYNAYKFIILYERINTKRFINKITATNKNLSIFKSSLIEAKESMI